MLKQSQQLKLQQKLSPQQIQIIRLLEIPVMQLEQRIKEELENNPLLEEGKADDVSENIQIESLDNENDAENSDEFTIDDYYNDDEYIPAYKLQTGNYSPDDKHLEMPISSGETFHELLEAQLSELHLSDREIAIATYLIGNIDDDGYLRRELANIVNDLAFNLNINVTEVELIKILHLIHDFEPTGVGARDLRECLLLQIETKDLSNEHVQLARKILKLCFDEFTRKHYDKIMQRLNTTEQQLKLAIEQILKLNPKPGSSYTNPATKTTNQITPDFILEIKEGEYILTLNSRHVPELRVNRMYTNMLEAMGAARGKNANDKEFKGFVKQKLESARSFIDAIQQRQHTLQNTMQSILNFQPEYFKDGDERKLRPMILKNIADLTGLDVSTISRVVNSKYVQTHFGIFPLKHFFSEGMQNDSGEEVSTREIKDILIETIVNEDKRKPVTDEELTDILRNKGFPIARRTVAKYREHLNIPVARMRKQLITK